MTLPLNIRSHLARRHACKCTAFMIRHQSNLRSAERIAVAGHLKPEHIVTQDDKLIITEVGFVTMAVFTDHAVIRNECVSIPGVDHQGQTGHLVLRKGQAPYHSLAQEPDTAVSEARIAQQQADDLVSHFGGRAALKKAATEAPWYLWSQIEDVQAAGLCEWGSVSFLQRMKLHTIGTKLGLPRCLLRLAGNYGNRVTAATLVRKAALSRRQSSTVALTK